MQNQTHEISPRHKTGDNKICEVPEDCNSDGDGDCDVMKMAKVIAMSNDYGMWMAIVVAVGMGMVVGVANEMVMEMERVTEMMMATTVVNAMVMAIMVLMAVVMAYIAKGGVNTLKECHDSLQQ